MAGLSKILLVEDNTQIIEIYSSVLKKAGYNLTVFMSADEALEKVKVLAPDLIFLDIMLPGKYNGADALMMLRTDPKYGCTKKRIVMLTNLGLTDQLQNLWEQYADGYVVKAEIDPHELLDIIKSFDQPA